MEKDKLAELKIFYEKNPQYRSFFCDGLLGAVTPNNMISLSFYATRNTIPKSTSHIVNSSGVVSSDGRLGEDSKVGIMREIEMGVYVSRETAQEIYDFLRKILEHDEQ